MTAPRSPSVPSHSSSSLREGITVGLIGAAVVAVFFLGVDLIHGKPFLTPSILGEVFVLRRPQAVTSSVDVSAVLFYSVAHLLVFVAFGLVLAALTRRSEESSLARYGVIAVFVAFEVFFYGVLLVASETTRGLFPSWAVLGANFLAIIAMASFLWRRHPALRSAFGSTTLGAPDTVRE